MDEDAEKEFEILSTLGDTLLLYIEGMRERNGRRPRHLSLIYEGIMDVVRELKDQL